MMLAADERYWPTQAFDGGLTGALRTRDHDYITWTTHHESWGHTPPALISRLLCSETAECPDDRADYITPCP